MKKIALITGINGQIGSYLADYLVSLDYEVHGVIRRHSEAESQDTRIAHLSGIVQTHYGDLLDMSSLENIVKKVNPDEIYNLAAQSHVAIGAEISLYTTQCNILGLANLLEVYRKLSPHSKFLQSSSSEMFGFNIDDDRYQRETTRMDGVSIYGISKITGYQLTRFYRRAYNLHACNSICFNNESPRRGLNFVTAKTVSGAVRIKLGLDDKLVLGNLNSSRDWSHTKDTVRAMHLIVNHNQPDDFVVSSMQTHSIKDMCKYVFNKLGMNYENYVKQDPKYKRVEELQYLRGDSTKARTILGWKPEYTFETLMDDMINHWMKYYQNQNQRFVGLDYGDLYPNLKGIK